MAEVSVIVPVYNMAGDGKLEYGIRSLVGQTLQDLEIIAVDDASTDDSLAVLKTLEASYPDRLRVIASPENRRQGGARNLGLDAAGDSAFIGFLDADDWVSPDLYERLWKIAKDTGADAVGCDLSRVGEHTMVPSRREVCNFAEQTGILDEEKRKSLLRTPGPVVTKLYRREIFEEPKLRFPEKIAYEDNAIATAIIMRIRRYEHIAEPLYFYYQRPGSTTHSVTLKQCEDRMEAMRIMVRQAKEDGSFDRYHEEYENRFFLLFYRNTLFSYMQSDIGKDAGFLRKMGKELLETFPDFRNNPYYLQDTDEEERSMTDLQLRSTGLFLLRYKILRIYRRLRYGKRP
jgi:glycosyltransferase involved in cell wall biosynthesis